MLSMFWHFRPKFPVLGEFTENIFVSDHPLFCKDALFGSNGAWLAAQFFFITNRFSLRQLLCCHQCLVRLLFHNKKNFLYFCFCLVKASQYLHRECWREKRLQWSSRFWRLFYWLVLLGLPGMPFINPFSKWRLPGKKLAEYPICDEGSSLS